MLISLQDEPTSTLSVFISLCFLDLFVTHSPFSSLDAQTRQPAVILELCWKIQTPRPTSSNTGFSLWRLDSFGIHRGRNRTCIESFMFQSQAILLLYSVLHYNIYFFLKVGNVTTLLILHYFSVQKNLLPQVKHRCGRHAAIMWLWKKTESSADNIYSLDRKDNSLLS